MVTSNLCWAVLAGLGAAVLAFGCSDDFHDVGDAENTDVGGSAGNGGNGGNGGGNGGSAEADSEGTSNGSTVTHTTGQSASGPAVTSTTTSTGISTGTTGEMSEPRCDDGVMNGDETDVDCGGADCPSCQAGETCNVDADCETAVCVDEVCAVATCDDNLKNGDETDIDCGGACEPCDIAHICLEPIDCASGRCVQGRCEEDRPELADCSASPAAEVGFASDLELEALLVGAWLLCPQGAELPSEREPAGVVGVEFTSDYHYTYLLEDEDGQLVRGEGIDFTGDWFISTEGESATTGTDPTPILVRPEGSGAYTYYRPTFTEGPVQLRMDEYYDLFHGTRYVPVELPE